MGTHSNVDRESFQQFLSNAYAVQESRIDGQFLAGMLEVQRLIARGDLGLDGVMNLIVDSARDVAGAAGVTIGLLEVDQLTYRAGSGCSAKCIGSRVTASLTASAKTRSSGEILRVENAHTDTRIEGAICRQFGVEALLMLPIYCERVLAGVFEVLFSEVHAFQDQEVRTYQLMAALIEAAMCRAMEIERKKKLTTEMSAIAHGSDRVALEDQVDLSEDGSMFLLLNRSGIYERCGAALAAFRESPALRQPGLVGKIAVQRAIGVISHKPLRSLALAAVATGFGLTFWIAHGSHRPVSPVGYSTAPAQSAVSSVPPSETSPIEGSVDQPVPMRGVRSAALRTRRMGMGQDDVDSIGDDVTVRHFAYQPATQRRRVGTGRVTYIGEDVTVRHFTPKPQ